MNRTEFSNEFDIHYNSVMSNKAPGLDLYEKSVFLTKAQEEIILALFDPKGNKFQEGFDDTSKRLIDFSKLIKVVTPEEIKVATLPGYGQTTAFDSRSHIFSLPKDILLILNELVNITNNEKSYVLLVKPISYTEYDRLLLKPFKYPPKNTAWRLFGNKNGGQAELIIGPNDKIPYFGYSIRYLKKPYPIILDTEDSILTINGKTGKDLAAINACELDDILHQQILMRAVELAKSTYTGDLLSQISIGNLSATDKGAVPQNK